MNGVLHPHAGSTGSAGAAEAGGPVRPVVKMTRFGLSDRAVYSLGSKRNCGMRLENVEAVELYRGLRGGCLGIDHLLDYFDDGGAESAGCIRDIRFLLVQQQRIGLALMQQAAPGAADVTTEAFPEYVDGPDERQSTRDLDADGGADGDGAALPAGGGSVGEGGEQGGTR